jgi:hypothetical protein
MRFRVCPYDDYSTFKGESLDAVLFDEINRRPEVLKAAVVLVMSKMFELTLVDSDEVLRVLNTGRDRQDGEWEVVE